MAANDLELLKQYAVDGTEDAFAEVVRRHLNLVYSAAVRQVRSPQLAEDVAQAVFADLSRNALKLRPDTVLSAWLYQVTRRTAIDVVRREARRQGRERLAIEMADMNSNSSEWSQVEPLLDDAMEALHEPDRTAVLLRFFENKSLREVGAALGMDEDTAQKRVSRALEKLRETLSRRGIKATAGALGVVLSASAVQAAPATLAIAVSSATTAATLSTTTTKVLAMTTMQKAIIGTALAAVVGAGVYESRQASAFHKQMLTLQKQYEVQPGSENQIQQLQRERDDATNRLAALSGVVEGLRSNSAELLRLRAEVTRLQSGQHRTTQASPDGLDPNDPSVQHFMEARAAAQRISSYLEQMPDKKIPELHFLTDGDWLAASQDARFETDADVRKTLSKLRYLAKNKMPMGWALAGYTRVHDGQLPTDLLQLKPYFKTPVDDDSQSHWHGVDPVRDDAVLNEILARYKLVQTGNIRDVDPKAWIVVEKASVDKDYDTRGKFGNGTGTLIATGLGKSSDPDDISY